MTSTSHLSSNLFLKKTYLYMQKKKIWKKTPKLLTVTTVSWTEGWGVYSLFYALTYNLIFSYREHSTLLIQNLVPLTGDLTMLRSQLAPKVNSA